MNKTLDARTSDGYGTVRAMGRYVHFIVLAALTFFLTSCAPKERPEEFVTRYFEALKTSDYQSALALLGEEDRTYFDVKRFEAFLARQPYSQFLFGGSELGSGTVPLGSLLRYEILESNELEGVTEVIVKVSGPDVRKILGERLSQVYFFGDEGRRYDDQTSLELSKRVYHRLQRMSQPNAPTFVSLQRFILRQDWGQWAIEAPAWRAEAMLGEAKDELVNKNTTAARDLLEAAAGFVNNVDDLTRRTITSEAIAGKHMLKYLPNVVLSKFSLGASDSRCRHPASLTLLNGGERIVRYAEVVVRYLQGATGPNQVLLGDQVFALDKAVKRNAKTFLDAGETLEVKLCLQPPLQWEGVAETHVSWLEFAQ
jgi:hypothetical protein